MRALTLTNPWAHVVVEGLKPIENRTRVLSRDMLGHRFLIHAAAESSKSILAYPRVRELLAKIHPTYELPSARHLEYGALIGSARLVAMIPPGDDETAAWAVKSKIIREEDLAWWFHDQWGYLLGDVRRFSAAFRCPGALGFWTVPRAIAEIFDDHA